MDLKENTPKQLADYGVKENSLIVGKEVDRVEHQGIVFMEIAKVAGIDLSKVRLPDTEMDEEFLRNLAESEDFSPHKTNRVADSLKSSPKRTRRNGTLGIQL